MLNKMSEAIDTDQSVALMVAKVTNDTDRWKSVTETSIDTDIDHVNSYGQIVWRVSNLTAYRCSGRAVFNCTDYERGARNSWKTV